MSKPVITLDPGHGSTPGARGFDPGVTFLGRTEAVAALEACLTLKSLLEARGYRVVLTHDGTAGAKPDLNARVRLARSVGSVALVSVHYDSADTRFPPRHRRGVYYAPGARSHALAMHLQARFGGPAAYWALPSSSSRFGGLYIDSFPDERPAVLLELDRLQLAPKPGQTGRLERLALLTPIADALAAFLR